MTRKIKERSNFPSCAKPASERKLGMEKREEGCRGRLYKGIAKRSIIMDLWYKVQERAMRRLPRGEEIRVSSARLRYRLLGYGFFSFQQWSFLSFQVPFPLFFMVFFSPSMCMQVDPFLMPFSLLLSHDLLPFFPPTVGRNEEVRLQLGI